MRDGQKNRQKTGLIVPAVLVLGTFGPACGGKDGPTTVGTTGQVESGNATVPTGTGPTSSGSTGASTGTVVTGSTGTATTGGELPDCSLYNGDAVTCSSKIACLYLDNEGVCIVRCNNFAEQATCEMQDFCYWAEGGCYLAV